LHTPTRLRVDCIVPHTEACLVIAAAAAPTPIRIDDSLH
jgi:hypothetical protein